jgi:hypothetical protein
MGLAEWSERWFYRICTIFMFCICGYMILTQGFAKQKKMLDDSNIDNCKICYLTARLHPGKDIYIENKSMFFNAPPPPDCYFPDH